MVTQSSKATEPDQTMVVTHLQLILLQRAQTHHLPKVESHSLRAAVCCFNEMLISIIQKRSLVGSAGCVSSAHSELNSLEP